MQQCILRRLLRALVTLVGVSGLEGVSQVLIVCEIVLVFGNVSPMASTPVKHPPQSVRGAVALPIQGRGRKEGATMDYKHMVAARLAGVGVSVSDSELEQLTAAYTRLLTWETVVQGMVQPATEPALVFRAQEEG